MSGTNPGDPAPQNALWSAPEPQAVLGLNSSMTYGSQFQCAAPFNFQVGFGGNIQLVCDPLGFMKAFPGLDFPDALDALFGGGAFGSIQLTLGTAAQITMGRSYTVDLSPEKHDTHMQAVTLSKPVQKGLGVALFILTLAYTIAYGVADDDDSRAILTMVYQGVTQLGVDAMMACENANAMGYASMWRILDQALFKTAVPSDSAEYPVLAFAELLAASAIIVVPIMDSVGEKHLDDAKAQQ